jgi:hypothetical protein
MWKVTPFPEEYQLKVAVPTIANLDAVKLPVVLE